jgi:MerR family copper efflux transcriptional regulator
MRYLISQLSKITEIPIGTIRFYEKSGLIAGEKDASVKSNNYTYYSEETIEKLDFIKEAKSVGFTLAEIKDCMDAWFEDRLNTEDKLQLMDDKIAQINAKIEELQQLKEKLAYAKQVIQNGEC